MLIAGYILGWCLGGISFAMLAPAIYALLVGETPQAMAFMNSSVALFFLAGGLIFSLHQEKLTIGRRQQLLIVLGIWGVLPLGAALPYYLSGALNSYSQAYFEAVSAYTTTGASTFGKLSEIPRSIILWRSLLQWLGGLTTLLTLSFIIGRIMGAELFGRDASMIIQSNRGSSHDLENTFATILPLYLGLTIVCFLLLILFDIPVFDAFCLSLTTLSTGGLAPSDGAISLYGSPAAELTLAFFMFLGAVSLVWVKALIDRNRDVLKRTYEPVWILFFILALGILFAVGIIGNNTGGNLFSIIHGITLGVASAASLITTTGFAFANPDQVSIPYLLLLPIAMVGGGRYSTAGGLKFNRVLTMFDLSWRELRKLLYPHGVNRPLYGSESREKHVRQSIWSIFTVTLMAIIAIVLALSYIDIPLTGAVMAAVGAFGNFGPAYDIVRELDPKAIPAVADMSANAQMILCFGMIFGRVESLILLGLLNFAIWRK